MNNFAALPADVTGQLNVRFPHGLVFVNSPTCVYIGGAVYGKILGIVNSTALCNDAVFRSVQLNTVFGIRTICFIHIKNHALRYLVN